MNVIERLKELPEIQGSTEFLTDSQTGQSLSYTELHSSAQNIAHFLRSQGVRKGDRIALLLPNSGVYAQIYFACLHAGIITVPINPLLSPPEIEYILKDSDPSLFLLSDSTWDLLPAEQLQGLSELTVLVRDDIGSQKEQREANRLLEPNKLIAAEFDSYSNVHADDIMTIVYTSGTTASPKGVCQRIGSMLGNGALVASLSGIGEQNRFYNNLPMAYLGGYYNLTMLPYIAGSSIVIAPSFSAADTLTFWDPVIRHKVNSFWFIPTIMSILLKMDRGEEGAKYCRENVIMALSGTAPLLGSLRSKFETRYGLKILNSYGISETFFISTDRPSGLRTPGSVGEVLPGIELGIYDEAGSVVDSGVEGEICVRTPFRMKHYLGMETSETRNSDPLWFETGDVGFIDQDGSLFITDRKKDLIIKGGSNISAASIEEVLYSHPHVIECAVVGKPHPILGEDIVACVRIQTGYSLEDIQGELMDLFNKKLSLDKKPEQILEVDDFPRSSTGKIQKGKIREQLIAAAKN